MRKFKWTDCYALRRKRMVDRLAEEGISDPAVLAAMGQVPRHYFVEEALAARSYGFTSLPIGGSQTISQPYIVAKMTELLLAMPEKPEKVLEIGTGCGYQTAILEAIGIKEIYSIERLGSLRELAKKNLYRAHKTRARLLKKDGYLGFIEAAPFDAILLTAAPQTVPVPLLQQLKVGGRLILPLGRNGEQYLWVIDKYIHGFRETCLEKVNFVPLLRGQN